MEADQTICFCYGIQLSELAEAIQRGMVTLTQLQDDTLACTGCGGCESDILEILRSRRLPPEA